ncbi:hypothetical protein QO200_16825 [Flavobacterium sp. Arc3]|uniref:hypothetical protein n=1 Tax=Flavobacterium sp. Arc3 TaxID=3046686 RepID=UPI00352E9015
MGYTAAKGAYLIDVVTNSITPIIESTKIVQCKSSYNLSKLGVLLYSGEFLLFDLNTLQSVKNGNVIAAVSETATQKPQFALSERFVYITSPSTGELVQVNLSTLKTTKIKTSTTPYSITLFGHENSAAH